MDQFFISRVIFKRYDDDDDDDDGYDVGNGSRDDYGKNTHLQLHLSSI